jgi:hypothetical protein
MNSHIVLKRFVKDYSLPIQIVQEPYFSYFINLYDKTHQTKRKLKLLNDSVNQFKTEEDFLHHYYEVRDKIITSVESIPEYNSYNSCDMSAFNVPNNGYSSSNIFNESNVGKYFVSIDLVHANFQCLQKFFPNLVFNCDDYEELIGKFTNLEYMRDSKYLRQVIFGNMNPKRQGRIQRYMTEQILNLLLGTDVFNKEMIKMVSNDEIIFELSEESARKLDEGQVGMMIKHELGYDVDAEIYQLKQIGNKPYFVKEFLNMFDLKEFNQLMCVPVDYHAQVYKKYYGLEICDYDLCFWYQNQVCKFINPINWDENENVDE